MAEEYNPNKVDDMNPSMKCFSCGTVAVLRQIPQLWTESSMPWSC